MLVAILSLTLSLDLSLDLPTPSPSLRPHPPTTTYTPLLQPIPHSTQDSIQINFGDFGAAALLSSLQIRYYDEATHIFILRCPREGYRSAWAAMTLVTNLSSSSSSSSSSGTKASISVLRVSGSVRTCRTDAVEILVAAAKAGAAAAAAAAGVEQQQQQQQQMEEDGGEEEGLAEAKRAYYQAQIEGAIQGV